MKFTLPATLPKAFRSSFQDALGEFKFDDTAQVVIPFLTRAFAASGALFMLELTGNSARTLGCACTKGGERFDEALPFSKARDQALLDAIRDDLARRTAAVTYSALSWPHPRTTLCDGAIVLPREYNLLLPLSDKFAVSSNHTPRFSGWVLLLFDSFPSLSEDLIQLIITLPEVLSQLLITAMQEEALHREHIGRYAHDVKHHLMIVDELILGLRSSQGERTDRIIDKIEKIHRRLMLETNSVLLTDKYDAGHLQISPMQISINEIVQEAVHDLEPLFRASNKNVDAQLDDNLGLSPIDPAILPTVVHNLLDNALKYSDESSTVTVKTYSTKPSYATLEVSSNGADIPVDERKYIFRRHFRAKNSSGKSGSGLGLYLVRQVVEAHKGHVELVATANCTRFLVHLPLLGLRATLTNPVEQSNSI